MPIRSGREITPGVPVSGNSGPSLYVEQVHSNAAQGNSRRAPCACPSQAPRKLLADHSPSLRNSIAAITTLVAPQPRINQKEEDGLVYHADGGTMPPLYSLQLNHNQDSIG